MGSVVKDKGVALGQIAQKMAAKENPDKFETYNEESVGADGAVYRKTLYRPKKTLQPQSSLSSTTPLTDQEYKNSTGRYRSTLLGG